MPPALQPPQFRLATMLWIVAGLSVLFAAMVAVGPLAAFGLLLLVLSVFAHVIGAALGGRLRSIGNMTPADGEQAPGRRSPGRVQQHEYAPATALRRRTALSTATIAFTVSGAALAGVGGGALLIWITWGSVNLSTAAVAVGSSSVLGGLLGFATGSFTQIAGGAWREAHTGE